MSDCGATLFNSAGQSTRRVLIPSLTAEDIEKHPNVTIEKLLQAKSTGLEVESIKVFKGADAAIYGIRGMNGVIAVTTKKPATPAR